MSSASLIMLKSGHEDAMTFTTVVFITDPGHYLTGRLTKSPPIENCVITYSGPNIR